MSGARTAAPSVNSIPCEIRSAVVRRAVSEVFEAIHSHPRDWARLCRRVRRVGWLSGAEERVLGEWRVDRAEVMQLCDETQRNPRLWHRQGTEPYLARGWIGLPRGAARRPAEHLVALLAHECGHAVTRARDFNARERYGDGEWASELCADMYAFRWGFEAQMRAEAPFRDFTHHAVLPGQTIWQGDVAYRVDRRFFVRRCPRLDGAPESA